MQKTIIAAAVAGLLAMPAFAQTRVILSGKINGAYEWSKATGATHAQGDIKMRDRLIESGSELHIKAYEDLGNGNQAFVDIQTAVDIFGGNNVATPGAGRIGSRRGAIGLQGKWGMLQLGKWDIHYNLQIWSGTGPNAALNQMFGAVSLLNQVGGRSYVTLGCRCDNTIRYVTPNISGFEVSVAYTLGQGSDMLTGSEVAWRPWDQNKVNRAVGVAAKYKWGGLKIGLGYWYNSDAKGGIGVQSALHPKWMSQYANNANYNGTNGAAILRNDQSIRAGVAYTFDMGLTIGVNYDYSQTAHRFGNTATGKMTGHEIKLKRSAWAFPLYYKTGAHQLNFAYGFADDLDGWDDTGAQYWTINYGYSLSKRTTLYAGFAQYKNDKYASYDFWSNTAVGLSAANVGADPTSFTLGIIHSF